MTHASLLAKLGWGALGLAALAAGVLGTGVLLAERKAERHVEVDLFGYAAASGPEALERGAHLFASRGCAGCHGANGAGHVVIDHPNGLYVRAPNITRAGVTASYRPQDWERALRHGVKPSGQPLLVMPSEDYNRMTNADLGALVAYTESLPPLQSEPGVVRFPLLVKVLYGFGGMQDAAEKIDHGRPPVTVIAEGVTGEYGEYVAQMCLGCHGPALAGGKIPGAPPDWPPAARLDGAEDSVMRRYASPEAFKTMMRSGKRPDGTAIEVMPFESLRSLSDTELEALHLYLRSLGQQAVTKKQAHA
jgi:mono/diheme cytochrome c family protein